MNRTLSKIPKNVLQNKSANQRDLSALLVAKFHQTNVNNQVLTLDSMNHNVVKMQYAVRGPIVLRAGQIENELAKVIYRINFD